MKKGISPVISYVLVISIVLITTIIAYVWALPLAHQLGEAGKIDNFKNQMIGLDYTIRSVSHGDINFTSSYEMHIQDATLYLDEASDTIQLRFYQEAGILGNPNVTGTTTCTINTEFMRNAETKINMYRESNISRVYMGAREAGAGQAEFMICYYDIDLKWGNECSYGRGGQSVLVKIRKTGVSGGKPLVTIDIC